ncbi:hypothetical protein BAJUN_01960 [Bajunvirus bajun]|uniref:Uncharacterized protein n=1 Tax=Brevundimonas phage vB_BgoS-Bajun TaxID=2948594 RepID=A0A9E7STC5_9CAUD|nr:hypothetical protein BAJUN_01960 [Brevundimonas phage vB_BgoS-Bajun]
MTASEKSAAVDVLTDIFGDGSEEAGAEAGRDLPRPSPEKIKAIAQQLVAARS